MIYRRVSIDEVFEDPANARTHDAANLSAITGSLRAFGQVEPLVVQRSTMKVVGGNGRLKAMRALGWTEVDIADADIDNASAAALGIALNRSAELADWDGDALDSLMRTIESGDEDLQAMLASLAEDQGIIPPDEVDLPALEATTRHTVSMAYMDEDIPTLCEFLGVDELPEQQMGKVLLERIKDSVASPAN